MKMNKANQARQAWIAAILWERLVDAFNEDAKTYVPEHHDGSLGSVGRLIIGKFVGQIGVKRLAGGIHRK
jgi:hypothetical protein